MGQVLAAHYHAAHMRWARQHVNWSQQKWNNVLFTDESRLNLSHANGREQVYCQNGEWHACVCQRNKYGEGSIMVWGGIMGQRKTRLNVIPGNLNAQCIMLLGTEATPFLGRHGPGTLQQDNTGPHTAALTCYHLPTNNIGVLDWPALSPDMNTIEQIRDELGRWVRQSHQVNVKWYKSCSYPGTEQYSEHSGVTLCHLTGTSNPHVNYSQQWPHTLLEMNFGLCTMNVTENLFWTFLPHILPCPWISGFFSLRLSFHFDPWPLYSRI